MSDVASFFAVASPLGGKACGSRFCRERRLPRRLDLDRPPDGSTLLMGISSIRDHECKLGNVIVAILETNLRQQLWQQQLSAVTRWQRLV